jgi:hypothetical protein
MNRIHVECSEFIIGWARDGNVPGDTEFMVTGGFKASLKIFAVHPCDGYTSECVKYN